MKWFVLYITLTVPIGADVQPRYALVGGETTFSIPRFVSKEDCHKAAADLVGPLTQAGYRVSTRCEETK